MFRVGNLNFPINGFSWYPSLFLCITPPLPQSSMVSLGVTRLWIQSKCPPPHLLPRWHLVNLPLEALADNGTLSKGSLSRCCLSPLGSGWEALSHLLLDTSLLSAKVPAWREAPWWQGFWSVWLLSPSPVPRAVSGTALEHDSHFLSEVEYNRFLLFSPNHLEGPYRNFPLPEDSDPEQCRKRDCEECIFWLFL